MVTKRVCLDANNIWQSSPTYKYKQNLSTTEW